MKKFSIIALLACAFFTTSCETDATLDGTRVPEVTAPTVSFEVSVNKYDATFNVTSTAGNPEAIETGVMVSTEKQPNGDNSTVVVTNGQAATATFAPGTTYYVCAYALTANKLVTSEVKSFTTAPHPLGAYVGNKVMTAGNLFSGSFEEFPVTITLDAEDETVAYMTGLGSQQVSMALGTIKLVFDVENGTVTIPDGQIIAEAKYGNYRYMKLDENQDPVAGDIVGTCADGVMEFESLAALIVAGGNAGLFHWACVYLTIE